jgi:hypothetical protein
MMSMCVELRKSSRIATLCRGSVDDVGRFFDCSGCGHRLAFDFPLCFSIGMRTGMDTGRC